VILKSLSWGVVIGLLEETIESEGDTTGEVVE